jgi:hypothetical protein
MDANLQKYYQDTLKEHQDDNERIYRELATAQGLSIQYYNMKDGYKVWDHNDGSKVIFDAVSIEQANEFVYNRAISKLLCS